MSRSTLQVLKQEFSRGVSLGNNWETICKKSEFLENYKGYLKVMFSAVSEEDYLAG